MKKVWALGTAIFVVQCIIAISMPHYVDTALGSRFGNTVGGVIAFCFYTLNLNVIGALLALASIAVMLPPTVARIAIIVICPCIVAAMVVREDDKDSFLKMFLTALPFGFGTVFGGSFLLYDKWLQHRQTSST